MHHQGIRLVAAIAAVSLLGACEPKDERPGLWLRGDLQPFPEDWSFTKDHMLIGVQVAAPYFLPHSINILCAEHEGDLYLSAYRPETKNWPAWVTQNPNVVLKVGEERYEGRLTRLDEPIIITEVLAAYASKYRSTGGIASTIWFWRVDPPV